MRLAERADALRREAHRHRRVEELLVERTFGRPVVGQRGGTTGSRYERPSTWPRADMLSCSSSWKREAASAHADADAITYDVDSGSLSTAGTRSR